MLIEGASVLLLLLLFPLFEQTYLVLNLLFDGVLLLLCDVLWWPTCLGSLFFSQLGLLLLNVLLFNSLSLNMAHSFLDLLRLLLVVKQSIVQSFIILLLALYELLHLLLILEHQDAVSLVILLDLWLQCFLLCVLGGNHVLRRLLTQHL